MLNFFLKLGRADFIPHGHCYLWRPAMVWLHSVSDAVIALAYFLIPLALVYLVRRRRDLVYYRMFWMFAAFILLCGTTHVLNIVTIWHPVYRLDGFIKAVTGLVSIGTAIALVPLLPRILAIPLPEELEAANRALRREVQTRLEAEAELVRLNNQLEARVTERTAALERSNEDLRQFAYVASHDLQEPLRMISNYAGLIKRRYGLQFDSAGHEFLEFVLNGATRLSTLIGELLTYSHVDASITVKRIDLNALVDEVSRVFESQLRREGGRIERGELPELETDGPLLSQVFQNLISNALKYRGVEPPCVQVWASLADSGKSWCIHVRDNGTGFDMQYKPQLFKMFQRIDTSRPGSGIGLATCRKIVQRLGGSIDVISTPGQGSTFFFTLPATKL